MNKNHALSLLIVLSVFIALPAVAYDYALILKNGDNPDCNIVTNTASSRIVIGYEIVELSQFTQDDGTYTYQWSSGYPQTVAIQVNLAKFNQPDIWANPGCVYAPTFNEDHTTFTQQYLEPDPAIPYTCSCTSEWND